MILTGLEIAKEVKRGNIFITDFDETRINPNSYNLKLHNKLLIYTSDVLDMKKMNPVRELIIPPEGLVLLPGELYLGRTVEFTKTHGFVSILEGRSSIGRLGVFTHVTAGFGDNSFEGYWTLEIKVIKPIRVYAGVEIVQIYYNTLKGELTSYDNGKYQNNSDVQASMLYKDFQNDNDIQITALALCEGDIIIGIPQVNIKRPLKVIKIEPDVDNEIIHVYIDDITQRVSFRFDDILTIRGV